MFKVMATDSPPLPKLSLNNNDAQNNNNNTNNDQLMSADLLNGNSIDINNENNLIGNVLLKRNFFF